MSPRNPHADDLDAGEVCAAIRRNLAERDAPLSPAEVAHIDGCAACRRSAAEAAPEALFALLVLERKDEAFWTGFDTRVMAAVRESGRGPRGILQAILRPRTLALGTGAALIAAWAMLAGIREPLAPRSARTDPPASETLAAADGPMPLIETDAAPPAPVESVFSPTARVVTINVETPGPDSSEVVMIVDQGIDI